MKWPAVQHRELDLFGDRRRVVLEGTGREVDVADLRGEHLTEVLAAEEPLDVALGILGEVEAVLVEEAHDHRLRDHLRRGAG